MSRAYLTIMCGLPRSGKSTWINRKMKNAVVISPDKVRSEIFGHQYFANSEDFIWGVTKAMARLILAQGKHVLIDATHITFSSRRTWIRIAEQYDAGFQIVWVKTSMAKCIERNEKSAEGQKLPDGVIERMAANFEDPYYLDNDSTEGAIDIRLIEYPKPRKKRPEWTVVSNYYQDEVCKGE